MLHTTSELPRKSIDKRELGLESLKTVETSENIIKISIRIKLGLIR